ncbi:MAG: hypothetical protein WC994_01585 [Brumimicrobium sp.]
MNKTLFIGIFASTLLMTSCISNSNQIEKDASELAKLVCRSLELMPDLLSGDEVAAKEISEIEKKFEALESELDKKYPIGSDDFNEMEEIFNAKLKECSGIDASELDEMGEEYFDDIDFEELEKSLENFNLDEFEDQLNELEKELERLE